LLGLDSRRQPRRPPPKRRREAEALLGVVPVRSHRRRMDHAVGVLVHVGTQEASVPPLFCRHRVQMEGPHAVQGPLGHLPA